MVDLAGKRVLITRPREQYADFADLLASHGAIPLSFPVISIASIEDTQDLDQALGNLASYRWLVFTSVNGVHAVWRRMVVLGITQFPSNIKIAAIGPKTAAALDEIGAMVNFMPAEYIAEAILPGLGDIKDQWILLLRADIARPDLANAIQNAGGIAHEIAVYHTVDGSPSDAEWDEFLKGVDMITFTSASTVKNFANLLKRREKNLDRYTDNAVIACIGPIAARAAHEIGLKVDIVADEYTIEGLLFAMRTYDEINYEDRKINE
jgi:uroporphyrinogen-III synthase